MSNKMLTLGIWALVIIGLCRLAIVSYQLYDSQDIKYGSTLEEAFTKFGRPNEVEPHKPDGMQIVWKEKTIMFYKGIAIYVSDGKASFLDDFLK